MGASFYDNCLTNLRAYNKSISHAIFQIQDKKQSLIKFEEHLYDAFVQEIECKASQIHDYSNC